jgi:hypothetical protein
VFTSGALTQVKVRNVVIYFDKHLALFPVFLGS